MNDADLRQCLNHLVEAIRAMDLEAVMSSYADDIVSFDAEPPLQHLGAEAKRRNWTHVFAMYEPPLGYEIRGLAITVGEDVAVGHSLNRISGTLKNGKTTSSWVRATTCFRKIDGTWLIVHDHVSVPLDRDSGRALLNLQP